MAHATDGSKLQITEHLNSRLSSVVLQAAFLWCSLQSDGHWQSVMLRLAGFACWSLACQLWSQYTLSHQSLNQWLGVITGQFNNHAWFACLLMTEPQIRLTDGQIVHDLEWYGTVFRKAERGVFNFLFSQAHMILITVLFPSWSDQWWFIQVADFQQQVSVLWLCCKLYNNSAPTEPETEIALIFQF